MKRVKEQRERERYWGTQTESEITESFLTDFTR